MLTNLGNPQEKVATPSYSARELWPTSTTRLSRLSSSLPSFLLSRASPFPSPFAVLLVLSRDVSLSWQISAPFYFPSFPSSLSPRRFFLPFVSASVPSTSRVCSSLAPRNLVVSTSQARRKHIASPCPLLSPISPTGILGLRGYNFSRDRLYACPSSYTHLLHTPQRRVTLSVSLITAIFTCLETRYWSELKNGSTLRGLLFTAIIRMHFPPLLPIFSSDCSPLFAVTRPFPATARKPPLSPAS